jgi:hypothetical protein
MKKRGKIMKGEKDKKTFVYIITILDLTSYNRAKLIAGRE